MLAVAAYLSNKVLIVWQLALGIEELKAISHMVTGHMQCLNLNGEKLYSSFQN